MKAIANRGIFEMAEHCRLDAVDMILPLLRRTASDPRPVVVMTCGLSGAGKSTLAKGIIDRLPHLTRLSIDAIIFERHGLYAINYPADEYAAHQAEALKYLTDELGLLLRTERQDVVLDLSFWNREFPVRVQGDWFEKPAGEGEIVIKVT
ncbi:AAA domain-containing protein [Hirsutella rhossiliensis]|uniref:AAA domain-containing protein n=1 Tax=Hirsutella rhossiliensis TaxID=111463 RepID=A0A9P8MPF1_9HYPO|nr:AAA domain-containing protein [Hirsutella rhossiliensis]KAH0958109.1 AAA domain-containing protein [Hirsutella rhossiliensis]